MSVTIQSPQTSGIATTPVDAVPLSERLQTRLPPPPPAPPRDDLARPAPDAPTEPPGLPDEHEQGELQQSPPVPRSDAQVAVPGIATPVPHRTEDSAAVADPAPRPDRRMAGGRAPRAAGVVPVPTTPKLDDASGGAGKVAAAITPVASTVAGTATPHASPPSMAVAAPVSTAEAARLVMPGVAERISTSPATTGAGPHGSAPAEADAPVARSSPTPAPSAVALAPLSAPGSLQSQPVAGTAEAGASRALLPPSPSPAATERRHAADATADTTSAPPAVAAGASPTQQGAAADGQSLAEARREDANLGTRQHVRAVRQAEALQTAMATRAVEGSQVRVAFNSWGAGHAVTARLEGGRVHLQPSTARVGAALASSVAPGDAGLLFAVESSDSATDERRRPRDQDQA